jgi:hypothetical protein
MDLSRVHINRPDFKELKPGINTQHIFAEVVLIERSPQGSKPMLYMLKTDQISSFHDLDILRHEFIKLPHPAFLQLGHVLEVNMNKKTILMDNHNLVTYKFLLLVASIEHTSETNIALHTLKDALLLDAIDIKNKMATTPEPTPHSRFHIPQHKKKQAPHNFTVPEPSLSRNYKYIEDVVHHSMPDSNQTGLSHNLNTSIKKLCFLQT